MLELKVFVGKFGAVNGLATCRNEEAGGGELSAIHSVAVLHICASFDSFTAPTSPIVSCKVPTLRHESGNDSVELTT